jgi:hypothetical protein
MAWIDYKPDHAPGIFTGEWRGRMIGVGTDFHRYAFIVNSPVNREKIPWDLWAGMVY